MPRDDLTVTKPSDREIRIERRFAAGPATVFEATTRADLIEKWMWGDDDWPIVACESDPVPGGALRVVWRGPEGQDMELKGEYREVDPPHRIVHTEDFEDPSMGGQTVVTTELRAEGEGTRMVLTILYDSAEARDGALESPMLDGMAACYDNLDGALERA